MKAQSLFFIFLIVILTGAGLACRKPRKGALSLESVSQLAQMANDPSIPTEEKYHELGRSLLSLFKEANQFEDPVVAKDHLLAYLNENREALNKLSVEITDWQKFLPEEDKIRFTVDMMSRPYAGQFQKQLSALEKKITGQEDAAATLQYLSHLLDWKM